MTGSSSPDLRPAGAYVHGVDGPVAIVTGRAAAWLLLHLDLASHRIEVRGRDPELDAVLGAITYAGNHWRATSATSAPRGSILANDPEPAAPSVEMTSLQAAELLGITTRAVRLACAAGRLPSTQTDGCWRITTDDLDAYRRSRAA